MLVIIFAYIIYTSCSFYTVSAPWCPLYNQFFIALRVPQAMEVVPSPQVAAQLSRATDAAGAHQFADNDAISIQKSRGGFF